MELPMTVSHRSGSSIDLALLLLSIQFGSDAALLQNTMYYAGTNWFSHLSVLN